VEPQQLAAQQLPATAVAEAAPAAERVDLAAGPGLGGGPDEGSVATSAPPPLPGPGPEGEPPTRPAGALVTTAAEPGSAGAAGTVTARGDPLAIPGAAAALLAAAEAAAVARDGVGEDENQSLRQLCQQPDVLGFIEESRRLLVLTLCAATLWFDGLFGGEADVENARSVSGRLEMSALYTHFEGDDYRARLRLNYDLPTLENRLRVFLGREEEERFVADRQEGLAVRSSVFGLANDDEWLAGLGYRLPGKFKNKVDLRFGGRVKSAPEAFTQVRARQNAFLGDRDVWRFRQTAFYENRDGFGLTASADWDRVLRQDLVLHWGSVGTWAEDTEGVAWRSAVIAYHNLGRWRNAAIAGELFVRGESDADVQLREYGPRLIFRQPLGRPYLFGEVIVGYTWPREELWQRREGSGMLGFGLELLFGENPW
jgi:hypothetical protein